METTSHTEIETDPQPESEGGGTAVADKPDAPKPRKKPVKGEMEIPARILWVVLAAAKEDGKYALTGVLVESHDDAGLVSAMATDARSLLVAECNRGIFDDVVSVYVPASIAKNAAKVSKVRPQDDQSDAVVTIKYGKTKCEMIAYTPDGPITFEWRPDKDLVTPPYRDVLAKVSDNDTAAARIGVTTDLVASTLKTMQKVVGKDPLTRVHLPASADKPIWLESQDGDAIKVTAVVMPAMIDGWEPKPKEKPAAEANADPDQMTIGDALTTGDESWRQVRLDALVPKMSASKLKVLEEHHPAIITIGDWQAWAEKKQQFAVKDVKGFGPGGMEQLDKALDAYWAAHPRAAEATPADRKGSPLPAALTEPPATAGEIKTAAELGLTPGRVAAACHPDLLARAQAGKVPDLRDTIGLDTTVYVVTPPPIPFTNDHDLYALRPLFSSVGGESSSDDEYHGIKVAYKRSFYYVGAAHLIQLVRDGDGGGEKPAAKRTAKPAAKKSGTKSKRK